MNNVENFVEAHETSFLAGVVIVVLIIGGKLLGRKNAAAVTGSTVTTPLTDTSGLTNGLVYVPTQTTFSTSNVGADYSGDPQLTSITNSPVSSNSPVSTTTVTAPTTITVSSPKPTVGGPTTPKPIGKPVVAPPVHSAPVKSYKLVWGARHSVVPGDTLAYIVNQSNMIMHTQQHMPSNVSYSIADLRAHNPGVTDPPKMGSSIILPSWELA
jgi:hypothetical protein